MAYNAIVARVHTRPHPNADRLQIGNVNGNQVIVGTAIIDGEKGIYFESDGQLSIRFAEMNDLIRRTNADGSKSGGMFDDNRRVRAMNLRGVKSDGFWAPLSYLANAGVSLATIEKLEEGDTFNTLDGIPICNKYVTPQTARAIANREKNKPREKIITFPEHFDTEQYAYRKNDIKPGSLIIITEKLHGTSGRYGNVRVERRLNWLERIAKRLGVKVEETEYRYMLGTRRVVMGDTHKGFYGNEQFRYNAVKGITLKPDEILYFELVGYTTDGKPIMADHNPGKVSKELERRYGNSMRYAYGCSPGECKLYVYRITQNGHDLSWFDVVKRCKELGLNTAPTLDMFVTTATTFIDDLDRVINARMGGASVVDQAHIREGVCIRSESSDGMFVLKHKSYEFKVMEGIIKDNPNSVDMEEVS